MPLHNLVSLTLFTLLLTPFFTTCAADPNDAAFEKLTQKSMLGKVNDYCAQSRIINVWNECLKPFAKHANAPLAPEQIQQWAQRAQRAVGIEESCMVPVRHRADKPDRRVFEAICGSILMDTTQKYPYGIQNYAFHHEAAHIRRNDPAYHDMVGNVFIAGNILSITALVSKKIDVHTCAKLVFAIQGIGIPYVLWHERYLERQADIEGSLATQCHKCVSIMATHKHIDSISLLKREHAAQQNEASLSFRVIFRPALKKLQQYVEKDSAYLSEDELDIISQRFEKERKVCEYHTNHPGNIPCNDFPNAERD